MTRNLRRRIRRRNKYLEEKMKSCDVTTKSDRHSSLTSQSSLPSPASVASQKLEDDVAKVNDDVIRTSVASSDRSSRRKCLFGFKFIIKFKKRRNCLPPKTLKLQKMNLVFVRRCIKSIYFTTICFYSLFYWLLVYW